MKTIIFKSDKKAKNYEIRAAISFHIFSDGELIRRIRTDDISQLNQDYLEGQIIVTEIK